MTQDSGSTATDARVQGVRTRFAPSPTGFQHIGGYRTALFDWLLARHYGGQFVLRIEDTDTARTVPGAVEALIEGFRWLDLAWDEGPIIGGQYGPYYQTQRKALYEQYTAQLIARGHAYHCFCTPERLQAVREEQRQRGEPPRYDRLCRRLTREEAQARAAAGESYTVRLAVPYDGQTRLHDELRGEIVFNNANLDDAVLLKSNGYPTYHLANVIDDHLMSISHVIRAEEWIPSAPLHVLVYNALGWPQPKWVHVPDVLGKDGKKLSKRRGALSLTEYRDLGYLPEAVLNYMALLGWSYDEKTDILSRDEIVAAFTLERVGTSPGRFDEERLLWLNGYYIRQMTPDALVDRVLPFLERPVVEGGLPESVARPLDREYAKRVLLLEQERMKTLNDASGMTEFFFVPAISYDPGLLIAKNMDAERTLEGLRRAERILDDAEQWEAAALEAPLRELVAELGVKPVQLFTSLRVAVTGRTVSPPLFETMEVLCREVTLARVSQAISLLGGKS
jgi:glutamyl-tRNA synthetase